MLYVIVRISSTLSKNGHYYIIMILWVILKKNAHDFCVTGTHYITVTPRYHVCWVRNGSRHFVQDAPSGCPGLKAGSARGTLRAGPQARHGSQGAADTSALRSSASPGRAGQPSPRPAPSEPPCCAPQHTQVAGVGPRGPGESTGAMSVLPEVKSAPIILATGNFAQTGLSSNCLALPPCNPPRQ